MDRGISRRRLLSTFAAAAGVSGSAAGVARAQRAPDSRGFDPTAHAYGFRNWSSEDQYFETPPSPSRSEIRTRIRTTWEDRARTALGLDVAELPRTVLDSIAAQLRLAVVQRAGTNGHCYGMVLTAQRYFENPETIPVDRRLASEIEAPTVPTERPEAPVYEEIVDRQADQFLRFRAFLGRRVFLYRHWLDTAAVLRDVRDVIERFGTAAVILFNETRLSHQVLAYGFEERAGGVTVPIYDPNRPAATYRRNRPELRFDRDDETLSMRPYGAYTGMVYSRYDRIEASTDRTRPGPLDHVTVDGDRIRESLFPLALVAASSEDVELAVVDPGGERVRRLRGTHTDESRGEYPQVCSRYGVDPGSYRVSVFGAGRTDYELAARVTDVEGAIVDETRTATIRPGEVHEYVLGVPEDGDGTLDRVRSGIRPIHLVGAGALGTVAGAAGYGAATRFRSGSDAER
ncbi:hypothetical protein [Halobellus rarus]|uniref:Uncharacterized protein n=1 Tax=Halobellus rarus TaxID=1126237 RepID=A0ABD6CL52_9EURY|nr:hypothetical protein [Halobellus rarus]